MNKSAIKKFAVKARTQLIEDVRQKAYELGITKEEIHKPQEFEDGFLINQKFFKKYEIKQRKKLLEKIKEKGYDQVIDEVAYTWFNRFIALRFMEVNDYLPTGVRVLSSVDEGKNEPDLITEALTVDLDVNEEIIYRLQDQNDMEDLYKYLLIKQCNKLHEILPGMFEEIEDYTELLLPNNLLPEGSVVYELVTTIPEEDWKEQVEIIGWLYQFYISEKKDEVFADLKKNKKITKENIPAATQLFTPKWIVQYMVENSLGRLWLESHPDEDLQAKWKYYLEEAEQEPEVQKQLEELKNKNLNPEEITVLDPCMGSGHILVYAFDVLYQIYESAGYSTRDIPKLIAEKNLYGLEIDDRAAQLAYFAVMMKARSYNTRFFREKVNPNLCSIQESNGIPKEAIDYLISPNSLELEKPIRRDEIEYLADVFHDAKEYGSILEVKEIDLEALEKRIEEIRNGETANFFEEQYRDIILEKFPPLLEQARVMIKKYDVVVTNPPYMGRNGMNNRLLVYTEKFYPDSKNDLFAVTLEKCMEFLGDEKYCSIITMHSWIYLPIFINLRSNIFHNFRLGSCVHMGSRAFEEIKGEKVQTVAFTFQNKRMVSNKPLFIKLVDFKNHLLKEKEFFNKENHFSFIDQKNVLDSPNFIPTYEMNEKVNNIIKRSDKLSNITEVKRCIATGKDELFLRLWFEVKKGKISFPRKPDKSKKWYMVSNGGEYQKWYGNVYNVLDWGNDGQLLKELHQQGKINATLRNTKYMFENSITYTYTSMGNGRFNARYLGKGFASLGVGPIMTLNENIALLGYVNSKVFSYFYNIMYGKTSTFETGKIGNVPVISKLFTHESNELTKQCINVVKTNWDSFETSWDFKKHPFLMQKDESMSIEDSLNNWLIFTKKQFNQLKINEEELNRIFIELYGLEDELTPDVPDEEITIRKADRERDVKSFISYAVGCMFGRYSLDEEGLVYAGGEFDPNRYRTFKPDTNNVIPITDDEYFEDDIVTRFVEFVKVTFGKEKLEENLDFIADTLTKKANETSRQRIRRYFLKDFYKDHVQTYKKRPIYWLFDSGKQNGFKALIYMHRYEEGLAAQVRTENLHLLQRKYEAEMERLDDVIESDVSTREKNQAKRKKETIQKQLIECRQYDQVIAHIANQRITIDLDDGVKVNYGKFLDVEVPQGEGKAPEKMNVLSPIKL